MPVSLSKDVPSVANVRIIQLTTFMRLLWPPQCHLRVTPAFQNVASARTNNDTTKRA